MKPSYHLFTSFFSDLNNLKIVTTTSNEYASVFGFTEKEVFDALEQYGLEKEKTDSLLTLVIPVIIPRSSAGFVLNVE